MTEALVSTIIPVYNRPDLIKDAVESVLKQSYRPIEIIIVDDGSTDDTPAIAQSLADQHAEVSLIRQVNAGPGPARQAGFEQAQGEFIQFLDSDDLLYPGKFELQVDSLIRNSQADISYGKTRNSVSAEGRNVPWKKTGQELKRMFPTVLAGRIWDTTTPLYRATLIEKCSGWKNLENEEDWEFDCQIAAIEPQLTWVNEWLNEQRDVAEVRASQGGSTDPIKLRDRARARQLILGHARRAGITAEAPEMQDFISYSFLVARQCALAGLESEAHELSQCLLQASGNNKIRLYSWFSGIFGYRKTTQAAEWLYCRLKPIRNLAS